MASADDFRRFALALPGAEEHVDRQYPDFRVGDKIFAILDANRRPGVVFLLPREQERVIAEGSCKQGRGQETLIDLDHVSEQWLKLALRWSWELRAPRQLRRPSPLLRKGKE